MNIDLSDCSKCHKPKKMPKSKAQSPLNQKQPVNLEPSKAWIKNIGAGTTKEMRKFKTNRDKTWATATHTPSKPKSRAAEPAKNENENVAASQTNGSKFDFEMENTLDKTMVPIQPIDDTDIDGPPKSGEQIIGNVTCDNFQTCIEFDKTLMNASNVGDTFEVPTAAQSKTIQGFKHFPLELNTVLEDDASLYDSMSTIDRMNARMNDPQKLSEELSTLKREWNENFNDTLPHDYDITVVNRKFEDVKPSRMHELSIPLGPFDFESSSSSSLAMNSTTLSTNTLVQLDKVRRDMLHMDLKKPEMNDNCNANILDAHTPFKVPSYAQFKSDKKSQSKNPDRLSDRTRSLLTQASNQVPNTPSLSKGAYIQPVYMREEDVNRLIESGHIFFTEGRLHYKHKNAAQKKIF